MCVSGVGLGMGCGGASGWSGVHEISAVGVLVFHRFCVCAFLCVEI